MDQDIVLYMNQGAGENLRLSCWDFGGQDTFYGLHHLYMGRNSVFVLLFNMEWFLPESDFSTHLAFLSFWLNSIAQHAADPEDHSVAPIILVGSHKDRVSDPKEHERISKMLGDKFRSAPAWSSVEHFTIDTPSSSKVSLCFFPVDNKLGSKDSVIREIKKTVQEVVQKEKYIKEKIPFAWLKQLECVLKKDRRCLTFDEVVKICQEYDMPSTPGANVEEEVLVMLKIFNDLGQLMHHLEPTLRHLVIVDPANYLVEPASRIICQHGMHENLNAFLQEARNKEQKLLTMLQEKGILDPKLLDILWKDRLKDKQDLLTLLVKFGFFVPLLRQVEATESKQSAGDLYLVPAILPTSLVRHESTATPKLVGYLFFALKDTMQGMRRKGYVTVDEVKRDGFFPMGLGPAVTGQIVSECQCLHDMALDDMRLSSTEISAAFGRHKFILRTSMELQMMELVILVDSSLLIAERVLDLVKTAAEKMVPNLEFALAVDLDSGGVCQHGAVDKPRSSLVIISGQGGLQGKLSDEGRLVIPVGPGQKWTSVKAQKHFEKWIPDKGLREQGYDCFISYRWTTPTWGGMDTKLVDGIYKKLSPNVVGAETQQIHVFLDRHCLEDGGRFDKDFAKALLKSTVVIPIVSCAALQKMVSLKVESDIDNLLVEWVIICELQEIGELESCLPVMLGNVFETLQKDGNFTSSIFAEGIVEKLPEVVVSKVVSFVQQVFDDNGVAPSKHLHIRTVRGTVETIMKGLGVKAWDVVSNPIRGANGDDSMIHAHAEWTRELFSTVATKAMICIEKAEAQGKAKVTQLCHKIATVQVVTEASTQLDRNLKNLFEKCGLAEHRERVCEVLGAKCVQDIAMAEDGDIETLTWLKPIERRKLKKIIADSKPDNSTKEEIPVNSSISSGKDKSGKNKSDYHSDKSSMNLAVNIEVDNRNVQENYVEKQLEIKEDTVEDTKGDRDKDVSEIQTDTSVVQKKWETLSADRAEECLREAMRRGGKPLNTSRLNIVGEGRAGKTAWLRAVSNKDFEDTTSTIGVKQSLLDVNKVHMETKCEGGWSEVEEGNLIMKSHEAITRLAAEIAVTKPQKVGLDTSFPGSHSTLIGSDRQQEAILGSSTSNRCKPEVLTEDQEIETDKVYIMYHGTPSLENAALIEQQGVHASKCGLLGAGVYVSRDVRQARRYSGSGVVFEVLVRTGRVCHIQDHLVAVHDVQGNVIEVPAKDLVPDKWHNAGYDTAWVPADCSESIFRGGAAWDQGIREETCVFDAARITVLRRKVWETDRADVNGIQWCFEEDSDCVQGQSEAHESWVPYSRRLSIMIESHHLVYLSKRGKPQFVVTIGSDGRHLHQRTGQQYEIDFVNYTQKNVITGYVRRLLRRDLAYIQISRQNELRAHAAATRLQRWFLFRASESNRCKPEVYEA
jgi:GTPase SAR1 family protein